MKQAEQPDVEWHVRAEHIFCPADHVMSGGQRSRQVNRVERLKKQQAASLPRKKKRAFHPQSNPNQNVPNIAEEKKILRPVVAPINRSPDDQPNRPGNLQPQGNPHGGILRGDAHLSPARCTPESARHYHRPCTCAEPHSDDRRTIPEPHRRSKSMASELPP